MHEKKYTALRSMLLSALLLALPGMAGAQEYTRTGAVSCVGCHSELSALPATAIFHTAHASRSDPSAPFSDLQCEACHGPGEEHSRAQRQGDNVPPARTFGVDSSTLVTEQNAVCLGCHESHGRLAWFGSRHEREQVPCAACHQVHRERDRVFEPLAQQQACFVCHAKREADTYKTSTHPLRHGSMSCSSCHDPHDGDSDFLLEESTANETCYTCHAEKRGPWLWEHAPAAEDCTLCHDPHGSNHPAMLVKRPPLLCQQCHSPAGHPSVAYTSAEAEDPFDNRFLLGRACLNCHSQVHGSNHPSGVKLHR